MPEPRIAMPHDAIAAFCRRWRVVEFALLGSAIRDDFDPARSDVDVLVRFAPDAPWSLFDLTDMRRELETIFGRPVDLVERAAVERSANAYRRRHILDHMRVIHAAV